jgi:hypothetical protein
MAVLMRVHNIKMAVGACPTIFDFESGGQPYYFRLRHGSACICHDRTGETVLSDVMPDHDGVCSWDDVVTWAADRGVYLVQG